MPAAKQTKAEAKATADKAGKAVAKTVKAKAKTAAAKAAPPRAATKTAPRKTAAAKKTTVVKAPAKATKATKTVAKTPVAKTKPTATKRAATKAPAGRPRKAGSAAKVVEATAKRVAKDSAKNPKPRTRGALDAPCRLTGKKAPCDKNSVYNYQQGCRNLACREKHTSYYREYRRGKRAASRVEVEAKAKGGKVVSIRKRLAKTA